MENGAQPFEVTGEEEASWSLEDIMQLGFKAAEALNAPIYQIANKIAVDQAIMDWANTGPNDIQRRENLWQEVQAHGRINAVMQGFVERARQAVLERNERDPNVRYLDEQGFGGPIDDDYPTH